MRSDIDFCVDRVDGFDEGFGIWGYGCGDWEWRGVECSAVGEGKVGGGTAVAYQAFFGVIFFG